MTRYLMSELLLDYDILFGPHFLDCRKCITPFLPTNPLHLAWTAPLISKIWTVPAPAVDLEKWLTGKVMEGSLV